MSAFKLALLTRFCGITDLIRELKDSFLLISEKKKNLRLKIDEALNRLVWIFIHLMHLVGFRNRIVVFMHGASNYFSSDKRFRLIIRPYKRATSSNFEVPYKQEI